MWVTELRDKQKRVTKKLKEKIESDLGCLVVGNSMNESRILVPNSWQKNWVNQNISKPHFSVT